MTYFTARSNLISYAFIWEKLLESHLMEETYSKWPEWQKVYVNIKILTPGLYTCIKTGINMYKIRLQSYFFETCNKWAEWQCLSVDIRILSTNDCLPLPWGYMYIHVEKHLKMYIKSEFKEIFWNLQQMVEVVRAFCWHQNFYPKDLSALAPGQNN